MQRQREKGMVTMMSKTERAVRMKAVMPGSLSSAAKEKKKEKEGRIKRRPVRPSATRREREGGREGRRGGKRQCARNRLKE